jgi:hypothetical protein
MSHEQAGMSAIAVIVIGFAGLLAVLYWLLDRHEQRQQAAGQPRRGGLAVFFAAAALLVMLFSGGCGLLFLAVQDGLYVTWQAVAVLSGPPFVAGLLVWWLARRRNKV